MLCVLNNISVLTSINFNSVEREITISTVFPSLSSPLTVFKSSISSLPPNLAIMLDSSETPPATPPTWNVRSVNCVPGSPIYCAAITPTASPFCVILPVAKFLP